MLANNIDPKNEFEEGAVIIVGTGPVGMKMAAEISRISPQQTMIIFGDEPFEPYDRVGLSSFLAGELPREALNNSIAHNNLVQHHNCRVVKIDRTNQFVLDETGQQHYYRKLILATGSRAHKPNIPGINLPHVFTFRDMRDVDELFARRIKSRCTVVIGGGLLGLEAARAMQKYNTKVVVVEHNIRLMIRQLNDELSECLLAEIKQLGIEVCLQTLVKCIKGEIGVTGVLLNDGTVIDCDTVIVATGITPNKDLALSVGLSIGRGIKVDENLMTSDANIYAVGECCEFRGEVYGLVAPGYEQAAVVAHALNNENVRYEGSLNVTKLKVCGLPVYSAGEVSDDSESITNTIYQYNANNKNIRVLVVRHRRIVGAMGIGPWAEFERIQEAIRNKRQVWPWQLLAFKSSGSVWSESDSFDVSSWPANAVVCSCKGISRGEITDCIAQGFNQIESISAETGASSVCGSCKPLVSNLLGSSIKLNPQWGYKTLFLISFITLFIIIIWLISPPISYAASVRSFSLDFIWSDFIYKQITGYTLAGITLLSIIGFSLRKRIARFDIGKLGFWRNMHTIMGLVALLILVLHTGLNTGSNLSFYLLTSFILASIVGAVSAYIVANEHKYSPLNAKRWRMLVNRAHIIAVWPMPVLLGFHITSAYYF